MEKLWCDEKLQRLAKVCNEESQLLHFILLIANNFSYHLSAPHLYSYREKKHPILQRQMKSIQYCISYKTNYGYFVSITRSDNDQNCKCDAIETTHNGSMFLKWHFTCFKRQSEYFTHRYSFQYIKLNEKLCLKTKWTS